MNLIRARELGGGKGGDMGGENGVPGWVHGIIGPGDGDKSHDAITLPSSLRGRAALCGGISKAKAAKTSITKSQ